MKWKILVSALLLAVVVLTHVIVSRYEHTDTPRTSVATETVRVDSDPSYKEPSIEKLLELTNAVRAKAGVKPLVLDERLNQSAEMKADELEAEGFDNDPHGRSDGKRGWTYIVDVMPNACYYVGENLMASTTDNHSETSIINAWVESPPHYKAMVNPNVDIVGFGIHGYNTVQHFCDLK